MIRRVMFSTLVGLSLLPFHSTATDDPVYIFCAPRDGSRWDWARDSNNERIPITGVWGYYYTQSGGRMKYYTILADQYTNANQYCRNGEVAQPAESRYSDWSIFRVRYPNGRLSFAPGRYTVTNERLGAPSAFRL
ncbi:hypothetical protein [Algicola sagamiensis]|uniref:hypothetical protein n=1 Tax=Algicola sagamiensis TaxID=163869 RepID=UPI0012FB0EF5|nr:hypothetical protein [Algicola sagamiensis]